MVGKIYPLVRWLKETPARFPSSVPYVVDLAKSLDDQTILSALSAPSEVGNPFAVSRQVPSDRLDVLRSAFAATMKDPDFLADAAHLQMPVEATNGADAQKFVASIYAEATPDVVERMKNAMK